MSRIKTIYFVDDDEDDLFVMQDVITELKIPARVRYISNGRDLLAMLDKNVGDALIVIDMNMPEMNGIQTLRAIYANPNFKHLRSILISTSEAPELQTSALAAGAMQFICKPRTYNGYIQFMKNIFTKAF